MPAASGQQRIMLKFIFNRTAEPKQPCWRHQDDFEPTFPAKALRDEHPFVRFNAISALINLRPEPQRYLPLLKQVADEDSGMQQWKASDTVRQLRYA